MPCTVDNDNDCKDGNIIITDVNFGPAEKELRKPIYIENLTIKNPLKYPIDVSNMSYAFFVYPVKPGTIKNDEGGEIDTTKWVSSKKWAGHSQYLGFSDYRYFYDKLILAPGESYTFTAKDVVSPYDATQVESLGEVRWSKEYEVRAYANYFHFP